MKQKIVSALLVILLGYSNIVPAVIINLHPAITSIFPTTGSTTGGEIITITGTSFTGATGITLGGNPCASFSVASATSATCVTPAGTVGTASVVVTTGFGSNPANTLFTYTVTTAVSVAAVPTLSEWSQMLLGLLVMTMIGWYFHRQRLS